MGRRGEGEKGRRGEGEKRGEEGRRGETRELTFPRVPVSPSPCLPVSPSELLRSALYRNITVRSKCVTEECGEIRAASQNKVVTVGRPKDRYVRFAVLVIITNNRLVAVLTKLSSKRTAV